MFNFNFKFSSSQKWLYKVALYLFVIGFAHYASGLSLIRGPYLQMGRAQSSSEAGVVIKWRTDLPSSSVVYYGTSLNDLSSFVELTDETTEHAVDLTELLPNTRYYYGVGDSAAILSGDDAGHTFVTPPAPAQEKPTRIWFIGDSGTANTNAALVRDAYKDFTGARDTDLWVMLGDNAYSNGTDSEYQRAVFNMYPEFLRKVVLWSTLGNHDGYSADSEFQTGPYYDIFTLPTQGEAGGLPSGTEAYYSFDYSNIHFICLDSYDSNRSPGGAMMTWLGQDIAATTKKWVIAFWHHPPYTKGSHNSDSETRLIQMRENALPIIEDYGVDLVLSGHSHAYERSILLDGHYGASSTLISSMKVDPGNGDDRTGGDGAYEKSSELVSPGAVYTVAGSSGKVSSSGTLTHPAMAISLRRLGSLVVDIDGNRLEANFIDGDGAVSDHFVIVKSQASVHVGEITMGLQVQRSRRNATAQVLIKNDAGQPVSNATVHGAWSGLTNAVVSTTTNIDGMASFKSSKVKSSNTGNFEFSVTDVIAAGYSYDAPTNDETSDCITSGNTSCGGPGGEDVTLSASITGVENVSSRKHWRGSAAIMIEDESANPVGSAEVTGTWQVMNGVNVVAELGQTSGATNSSGLLDLVSPKYRAKTGDRFCVTISGVTLPGGTYDDAVVTDCSAPL